LQLQTPTFADQSHFASANSVAGRWSFPLPPRPYQLPGRPSRLSGGLRRLRSAMLPPPSGSQPSRTSLPFRALSFALVGSPDRLSWDWPRVAHRHRHRCRNGLASADLRPSIDMLPGVHSCDRCCHLPLRVRRNLSEHRVPTSWFCTTSPVFSAVRPLTRAAVPPCDGPGVAGLLHPAADPGVRRISARWLPCDAPTPRRIPPPRSRTVSPRPLPSWRSPRIAHQPSEKRRFQLLRFDRRQCGAPPSRLCSAIGPVPSIAVFPRPLAYSSWALLLLEVLRPSRGKPRSGGWPPARRASPSNRGTIRVASVPLFEEPRTRRGFVERRSVLFRFVFVPTGKPPRSTTGSWPSSRRTRGHSRRKRAPFGELRAVPTPEGADLRIEASARPRR